MWGGGGGGVWGGMKGSFFFSYINWSNLCVFQL